MKKGFTGIELMIVVAIISLMSAIALPKFADIRSESKIANVSGNLANLNTAISLYKLKNESYPDLVGNEDDLGDFTDVYSKSKMPDTPSYSGGSKSNTVYNSRSNTGGWLYIESDGVIYANLEDGTYSGDADTEIWSGESELIDQEGAVTSEIHFTTDTSKPYKIVSYDGEAGTDLKIPSEINGVTVTEIGHASFDITRNTWDELTSVELPDTLTTIGALAFRGNNLESITIPGGVDKIGILSFDGNNLTDVTINEGVTVIGEWAFSNNDISNITIPNSVTKIDGFAFANNNTTEITIGNDVDINNDSFYGNSSNSFKSFYDDTGKEAGTYIYDDGNWLKQ